MSGYEDPLLDAIYRFGDEPNHTGRIEELAEAINARITDLATRIADERVKAAMEPMNKVATCDHFWLSYTAGSFCANCLATRDK